MTRLQTAAEMTEQPGAGAPPEFDGRLRAELLDLCMAMASHALDRGYDVPPEVLVRLHLALNRNEGFGPRVLPAVVTAGQDTVAGSPLADAAVVYDELKKVVLPATPGAIMLLARERRKHPTLSAFGPVPVVRHFLLLGAISLFVVLGVSLSPMINDENMAKSLTKLSGTPLLMVEAFLLSAASLGSCFSNLQVLSGYVSAGTYDNKYQSTYWTRWVMGVISGVLLSQVIYDYIVSFYGHGGGESGQPSFATLGQPALALLGGYAAGLVRRLLDRVIAGVDAVFGTNRSNDPRPKT